jgi:hypothetical protein
VEPATDGLKETILGMIEQDWAELSASPQKVAERIAEGLAPMLYGSPIEDEIRGAPWATR